MTTLHLTGMGWHDGNPVFRTATDTIPVRGSVRWGIQQRLCIGHSTGAGHEPCPHRADVTRGRQCVSCQASDAFRPCMLCDGSRCPPVRAAIRSRCDGPHALYIANFGGPEVKVGTTSMSRGWDRLIDQGPLFALRVAIGPGPAIKRLERLASTQTTLIEAVRPSQKLVRVAVDADVERAEARVRQGLADVKAVAPESSMWIEPELFTPPDQAVAGRRLARGASVLKLETGSRLEGTWVGAVGGIGVLDDGGHRFLVNLSGLVGRSIDTEPSERVRRSVVQLGLFA